MLAFPNNWKVNLHFHILEDICYGRDATLFFVESKDATRILLLVEDLFNETDVFSWCFLGQLWSGSRGAAYLFEIERCTTIWGNSSALPWKLGDAAVLLLYGILKRGFTSSLQGVPLTEHPLLFKLGFAMYGIYHPLYHPLNWDLPCMIGIYDA